MGNIKEINDLNHFFVHVAYGSGSVLLWRQIAGLWAKSDIYDCLAATLIKAFNATVANSPFSFYRAMLCMRGTSHGLVSVCHKSEFY